MTIRNLPRDPLKGRAQRLLRGTLGVNEAVLASMNGATAASALVLTDQRAIIIKVGWMTGQTLGGKVVSFPYRNITSVEVRASILSGTFEISSGGMQGPERSYWSVNKSGPANAWHSPNTIPINRQQVAKFQIAADVIREQSERAASAVAAPAREATATGPTIPEQIQALAALRDQGVLSADEFNAKKAELLARM